MIESLRGDLAALHKASAIGKVDARIRRGLPAPVREPGAVEIKRQKQRHWIPDIAARFREDDQNQSCPEAQ